MLKGEAHPMHKLTEKQVETIRELWKVGHRNIKVLAQNHKVSPANIKKINTCDLDLTAYISCSLANQNFSRYCVLVWKPQ